MTNPAERAIFLQAIDEESAEDRAAYLQSACGGDLQLRASVEALLAAHDQPAKLLDQPIGGGHGIAATMTPPLAEPIEHIGLQIDAYRLMEQIGEGGFGLVFVAQQEEPVARKVALKIVKPGSGSKEVIARFEAERQAVAMMNHPNIAQVFDAGVTADHRPYFVMELVRGLPITEFCDNHQLTVRERLKLLVDVCSAVHHAHQKGVIHRDIKPSNVMVTLHDAKPVAKVIDFGVAKAIGQTLTDKTIYTRFFSMIGTPLYMSPEQAEMSGLDIDTRSDIYSLGVLMYEMLVGATPFDRERMDSAGYDELRRIIREEDPPKPSKRLSTLNDALSTVATTRRLQPIRLAATIRGDLDWIVMKALEKDRTRRYESAAALAADIKRYLNSEPVEARPPSRAYQFRKFARRHRAALVTAMLVGVTMLIGSAVSLWQMTAAIDQRNQKEAALREATAAKAEIEQFAENITRANSLIASAQAHVNAGRTEAAQSDFDTAVALQPGYYQPWVARAQFHTGRNDWEAAAEDYAKALTLGAPTDTSSWWGTPALFLLTDRPNDYRSICERLDQRLANLDERPNWELLRDCAVSDDYTFSVSHDELARIGEAWHLASDAMRWRPPPDRRHDGGRPSVPREICLYILGLLYLRAGDNDAAIECWTEVLEENRWRSQSIVHASLAIAYDNVGRRDQAEAELAKAREAAVEIALPTEQMGPEAQSTPWFETVEFLLTYQNARRQLGFKSKTK
ncbi:Serine/threonine-protein kinase PknB [Rosistilla carotiformis]|uniref:Serine/threonine-protein kinase PknB n=1 Tax=Rosistilla carotiformis TaxID=2528017 RepID=A0A518JYU4_9BACT|nr:serine/threonine-protein kinase [Rosistilla carotiformis]QDV70714.1 Serine/threonine-protein kinase PknB [Rosistilla carotiformis]